MSRRAATFILGFALALLAGAGLWWWLSGRAPQGFGASGPEAAVQEGERVGFNLYFPAAGGGLAAEARELQVTEAPKDRIRKVMEALLAGPKTAGLARPFPQEVTLGSVLLGGDGVAYIDLRWPDHQDPPASGSTEELQRVYSVVDSVALNVPQARQVGLLWNGVQRETFSGHLDLSHPLAPDRAPVQTAPADPR